MGETNIPVQELQLKMGGGLMCKGGGILWYIKKGWAVITIGMFLNNIHGSEVYF